LFLKEMAVFISIVGGGIALIMCSKSNNPVATAIDQESVVTGRLPIPWLDKDIGSPGMAGSSSVDGASSWSA
jgi:hypothetical protein